MKTYKTKCPGFVIREAQAGDAPLLFDLICGLAEYEKMRDEVEGDPETLHKNLFENNQANVLIGEENGIPVCFALYFYNFSTFQCKHGLYLEDLFVKPEYRGKGYGSAMLACLAQKAREEDCGRFEWICLDWNEPALKVYRKIGAVPLTGWTIQRLTGQPLEDLADSF
ncbi:MAG: GNAT family N-acetyltransferase [Clostridia bacterium]|nr:GNAT family N-acetyltransferase [Clostridia bacterium]